MKIAQLTQEEKTIYVGLLTELQKDELVGQLFDEDSYFNPIQDINNNWIISLGEVNQCVNPEFMWVKDLSQIPYEPMIFEDIF
jgi:hypothetical protein